MASKKDMKNKDKKEPIRLGQRTMPFFIHGLCGATGGAIGMCVVHPADLLKTRMQILGQKASLLQVVRDVLRREGVVGLYKGLTSAIFRQYTYGLTRFAFFYSMMDRYNQTYNHQPPLHTKILMAGVSGMCGGLAGTPAEVALIRCTADGRLPPEKRRNYTHVFNALYRIAKEEGIGTWWSGVEVTISRAALVSAFEFGSYAQAREMFLPYLGETLTLHFSASMIAGLVATIAALPSDIVKTRVQNSHAKLGQIQAFRDIISKEGFLTLWKGFLPFYMRLGPHAVLQFVIFEQLRLMYFRYVDAYEV